MSEDAIDYPEDKNEPDAADLEELEDKAAIVDPDLEDDIIEPEEDDDFEDENEPLDDED